MSLRWQQPRLAPMSNKVKSHVFASLWAALALSLGAPWRLRKPWTDRLLTRNNFVRQQKPPSAMPVRRVRMVSRENLQSVAWFARSSSRREPLNDSKETIMGSPENALPSIIGAAVPRVDGPLKVSGNAMYTADFHFPGMVYAIPVCSTVAKGKITRLDASDAEKIPCVVE